MIAQVLNKVGLILLMTKYEYCSRISDTLFAYLGRVPLRPQCAKVIPVGRALVGRSVVAILECEQIVVLA